MFYLNYFNYMSLHWTVQLRFLNSEWQLGVECCHDNCGASSNNTERTTGIKHSLVSLTLIYH